VWRGAFTRASRMALLGLGDEGGLHLEPLGTFLEVRSEGGLGIGIAGEALIPQAPPRFLPLRSGRLHLTLERGELSHFALGRPHHDPALPLRRLTSRSYGHVMRSC
jgi:hypothetical protein